MNKSIASCSYSFILLGVLHTTSFPFSKLGMFRYLPPPAKVHYFSLHQKKGEKWKSEGEKKNGKLLWSECYFVLNIVSFLLTILEEPLFLAFLLPLMPTSLCYSSAGCGWMEFDYFRIVTGGWVQESLVG